ncbi:hypothetical protein K435DRAFT_862495 [Dendrothele bispora CBS 962.96]|uniref:Uncharacterized protein n=1 Tax=Dendrothele bispora (strain CBS 962.96) TaxID=1314807 RepID=A0A4S8LTL7_DENBC|nr:hypothetical protein K435DRAFT_862495 [Dendrothele bispora CBS 962.96]
MYRIFILILNIRLTNKKQHIVRTVILDAFDVGAIKDVSKLPPTTAEQLALFLKNPSTHGPDLIGASLDTSASTASAMKCLPWNQELMRKMALRAEEIVGREDDVDWEGSFNDRIYRILLDIQNSRTRTSSSNPPSPSSAQKTQRRRNQRQKFTRRQQICTIMVEAALEEGDEGKAKLWADVLQCMQVLTADGMSEEENGEEDGELVRYVYELDFRHPEFQSLFNFVDRMRESQKTVFNTTGRKRFRKVQRIDICPARKPPADLPPSYYKPEYLQLMRQGQVPSAKLAEGEKASLTIPRC